jgi:hypothetical protein
MEARHLSREERLSEEHRRQWSALEAATEAALETPLPAEMAGRRVWFFGEGWRTDSATLEECEDGQVRLAAYDPGKRLRLAEVLPLIAQGRLRGEFRNGLGWEVGDEHGNAV